MHVHEFQFDTITGTHLLLDHYRGQPILLVNTASASRHAPQLRKLQLLWENYRPCGLVLIGLPCNDFGQREPLNDEEIESAYRERFGISFPLTTRLSLRGRSMNPLFLALQEAFGKDVMPDDNFCKYLFGTQGQLVGRWPSDIEPDDPDLTRHIDHNLCAWII